MSTGTKTSLLRKMLREDRIIRAVGAHDAISARQIEAAGYDAIWASSLGLSASHALPDAGILTMTQYLDTAENMDAAVGLPVIADCDTGFGGPRNVEHMVCRYERRCIAAVCIEDKVFPKMNSLAQEPHPLVTIDDFVAKIRAGKKAQDDPDFMLFARTEALIAGLSMQAALDRAEAYADAGADAVLVHSRMERPDEVLAFAEQWSLDVPLVAVPTTYHGVHEQELRAAGFRLVIYANQLIRAQVNAVRTMLLTLGERGTASAVEAQIATIQELFDLQGMRAKMWAPP